MASAGNKPIRTGTGTVLCGSAKVAYPATLRWAKRMDPQYVATWIDKAGGTHSEAFFSDGAKNPNHGTHPADDSKYRFLLIDTIKDTTT